MTIKNACVTLLTCDRCGKTEKHERSEGRDKPAFAPHPWGSINTNRLPDGPDPTPDLCPDCVKSFYSWLAAGKPGGAKRREGKRK